MTKLLIFYIFIDNLHILFWLSPTFFFFFFANSYVLKIYSGNESFLRYMYGKYLLSHCWLPINVIFWWMKVHNYNIFQFIYFMVFCASFKKTLPSSRSFTLIYFQKLCCFDCHTFRSLVYLELIFIPCTSRSQNTICFLYRYLTIPAPFIENAILSPLILT